MPISDYITPEMVAVSIVYLVLGGGGLLLVMGYYFTGAAVLAIPAALLFGALLVLTRCS